MNLSLVVLTSFVVTVALLPTRGLSQNVCSLVITVADTRGRPVRGAELRLVGASRFSTTDERGTHTFENLPALEHLVDVRGIGYAPQRVAVVCSSSVTVATLTLVASPVTLDTVRVTAKPNKDPTGFRERMLHRKGGYFLTDSAIAKARASRMTDLLTTVPGVGLRRGRVGWIVELSGRGAKRIDEKPCPVVFYLDGMPFETSSEGIDTDIPVNQIVAAEVYSVATVPARFSPLGANCGVILLWTRASQSPD